MSEEYIKGYRVLGDPPKADRQTSTDSLRLEAPASKALNILWVNANKNGAYCHGREDEFTGDDLPSDEWAEKACAGCPVFAECRDYAVKARPSHGVHAGVVYGRELERKIRKSEELEADSGIRG